jgi:ABC-type branched-subunit amino acid transport system substrate-binding protein
MPNETPPPAHQLLTELGRGGVGIVHLARRTSDNALVVVKKLRTEFARDVQVRRMFIEEARIAAMIRHPNVVAIEDSGFGPDGAPWIEMEWAPGISLHTALQAAPMPLPLFSGVLAQLLLGLHHAHETRDASGQLLDIVHRDISPHNVLLTRDGRVKLIDFGIAKIRDSQVNTTTGIIKGKLTYMAPEQAMLGPVDRRADLFAVGVMLCQQLTGRRLWDGVADSDIMYRLAHGDVPTIPDDAAATSDTCTLHSIANQALAAKPEHRYESAAAMHAAISGVHPDASLGHDALADYVTCNFAVELQALAQTHGNALALSAGALPRRNKRIAVIAGAAALITVVGGAAGMRVLRHAAPLGSRTIAAAADTLTTRQCTGCSAAQMCSRDGRCVAREADGCTVQVPGLTEAPSLELPIYAGTMFPLLGMQAEAFGRSNARGAELAIREINRLAGGIPVGNSRRPLGLIQCDDAGSNSESLARAQFIAERAFAVIGFRTSEEALTLARDVFLPRDVFVIAALNSSPLLSQLPAGEPRKLLRTAANATAFALPLAKVVATQLVPTLPATEGRDARVAIVRAGNATGTAYAESVLLELERERLHAPRAPEVANIDTREVPLGDENDLAGKARAVRELEGYTPDIVVLLSDNPFAQVVAPYEAKGLSNRRPVYVAATPWEEPEFRSYLAKYPSERYRFLAVSYPTSHRAMTGFVTRYREAFGEELAAWNASPAPYDSVYLLAYMAAASRTGFATAADGARGLLTLLPPANTEDIGPATVVAGLAAAARGEARNLQGITSRFDFDMRTGDSPIDAVLQCTTYNRETKTVGAQDRPIVAMTFGQLGHPRAKARLHQICDAETN